MICFAEVDRRSTPSFEDLRRDYLRTHTPVILTDLISDWPALKRWTPDFFRSRYGQREVQTYDESFQDSARGYLASSGSMSFGDFIDLVHAGPTDKRLFLFDLFGLDPALRRDIRLPEWIDWLSRQFLVSFFGGDGGVTTFHYDVDLPHVFHAVLYGEKEFLLFAPDQTAKLYRHPWTVRSYVDVLDPDLRAHPAYAQARGFRCRVRAGETLVIPSRQWHQVRYPGPSWGLAFRKYEAREVPAALYNMLIQESVDRALTRAVPERWFDWKRRRAERNSGH